MSYTLTLVNTLVKNFVPMGDKIVEFGNKALGNDTTTEKKSKREQKARLATSILMDQAIRKGEIDPTLKKAVKNMKDNAKIQLAEDHYQNKQVIFNEIGKTASILNYVVPGSGTIVTGISRAGITANITSYANESSNVKETTIKAKNFVGSVIMATTSSALLPFITPLITPWVGAAATVGVLGTTVIMDTVNYMRNKTTV